ncbi:MAG: DUF4347 domain-containing protein [Myxococcota bacterium]|nr:DUF4347 domain-containing protein [Myxococcota bacterium]
MKLTLISYLTVLNDDFEEIALRARPTPLHQFRRCQGRAGFFDAIAQAAVRRQSITRLDIQGHGSPGGMNIGEELLVRLPRAEHWEELLLLLPFLAEGAEVRLLACHAGAGPPGRELVDGLAALWAERRITVLAATGRISCQQFGPDGFLPLHETLLRQSDPSSGVRRGAV